MNKSYRKNTLALASIFSLRMLGLFMILPVLTLYQHQLIGATPTLIGLALGIYGLMQALLQIPFGLLSDKIGRKKVITGGLLLFVIGSIVAACSTSIHGIILGRALQGMGAIGSTILALTADLIPVEHRTKAMATIGMMIGVSFFIAMIVGPILNNHFHLSGLFWITTLLACLGIVVVHTCIPTPKTFISHRDVETIPNQLLKLLKEPELLRLDIGILIQHATLTALFIALPLLLQSTTGTHSAQQSMLYLYSAVPAFFVMIPFVIIAEKKRKMRTVFLSAIGLICITVASLTYFNHNLFSIGICLFLFFAAFSLLEAVLPSLISKLAPAGNKGSAMGIYSSCQFLGIFTGGLLGGVVLKFTGSNGVFIFCGALSLLWLLIALRMKPVPHLATCLIAIQTDDINTAKEITQTLSKANGVYDAMLAFEEQTVHLKIDSQLTSQQALGKLIQSNT